MDFENLNGWQRLWIIVCIATGALLLVQLVYGPYMSRGMILLNLFLWVGFCSSLYGAGLLIVWIMRGFKKG